MKARDVLHHETLISNNITLKAIQMCTLGFSAQSLQVTRAGEAYKLNTQTRLEKHMSETPALQHYLVELTV